MTEAIQIISISEGMPTTALPSIILKAVRVRRDRMRNDDIAFAMVLSNMILGGFSDKQKRDPLDVVAPMFSAEELANLKEQREQQERMAMENYQIARLRGIR